MFNDKKLQQAVLGVMVGKQEKVEQQNEAKGKKHNCAKKVEHAMYGVGNCIAEQHADPDQNGNISWYTVEFKDSVRKVFTENLKVLASEMHGHTMGYGSYSGGQGNPQPTTEALVGNQHKIDMNKNNKVDAHDFKLLRAKKSTMKEEEEKVNATIIYHDHFTINLSECAYADYVEAAKIFCESEEDAVRVADSFYKEKDTSLVVEMLALESFKDEVTLYLDEGHEVSKPKYMVENNDVYAEFLVKDKDEGLVTRHVFQGTVA
jgi:hypothetical protein